MIAPTRIVQVGSGGMGAVWCRTILPPFVADRRIEVVAAVDVNPDALINAREGLGLSADRCYTDLDRALADREADAVTIVVPPAFHEGVVDAALARGLDILSEKPITDSLESSARVVAKVQRAGVRMGVTMNHRFDVDKATLRQEIREARNGRLDYLAGRFTSNARAFGRWRRFRHEMDDPMLIEGSVHHLDILADLAGAPCLSVWATSWRPSWAEYAGDTNVLAVLEFANGVRAQYEAATATAASLNGWSHEYVRAESEFATIILDRREVRRYAYDPDEAPNLQAVPYESGEVVGPPDRQLFAHAWLVDDFLAWRAGGPPMATAVDANLRSMMLVAGSIRSSRTGQRINLKELLPEAQWPPEYRQGPVRHDDEDEHPARTVR